VSYLVDTDVCSEPVKPKLAATAQRHELTVVTRNTAHFARTGVKLLNPFA
jgi:predicted nucleic acid-binding protein